MVVQHLNGEWGWSEVSTYHGLKGTGAGPGKCKVQLVRPYLHILASLQKRAGHTCSGRWNARPVDEEAAMYGYVSVYCRTLGSE